MNPIQSITTCFRKYFDFSGRATRSEFWWFHLFLIAATIIIPLFDVVVFEVLPFDDEDQTYLQSFLSLAGFSNGLFIMIFDLLTLLPTLAVTSRRLHDIGFPGWSQSLIYLALGIASPWGFEMNQGLGTQAGMTGFILTGIAIVVFIAFVFLWTRPGQIGPNRFGNNPLEPDMETVFS